MNPGLGWRTEKYNALMFSDRFISKGLGFPRQALIDILRRYRGRKYMPGHAISSGGIEAIAREERRVRSE
jgi:hypothetical protein